VLRLRQEQAMTGVDCLAGLSAVFAPAGCPAHLAAAQAYRRQRLAEAVADFRSAIRLKPDESPAHVNLARACRRQHRLAQALGQLDRASRLRPGQAALYRERAEVRRQRQDLEAARLDLEEAVRLAPAPSPDRAADLVARGRILYQQSRFDEAARSAADALAAWPECAAAELLRGEALLR
jgi:tetratricopeptide (TPR) repeat protein